MQSSQLDTLCARPKGRCYARRGMARSGPEAGAAVDHSSLLAAVLGRTKSLLQPDVDAHAAVIRERIEGKRILVTGAAGSIGSATVRQLAGYAPALLAAVDLSENNLVELVRDIRSSAALDIGDRLKTYVLDFGSRLAETFLDREGPFDLILHFAAMKHVRGERDVFTLARLIDTNVLALDRFLGAVKRVSPCDVFAVSTDKACRPTSFMGASKRLMEIVVCWHAENRGSILAASGESPLPRVATSRFANVAFSDGSLLDGFLHRIEKRQPLAGPSDVRRYFIDEQEAGELCMLTAALAESQQIFVPRRDPASDAMRFDEIAEVVVRAFGYEPSWYDSHEAARLAIRGDLASGRYPCCFTASDTSGEKELEEFVAPDERLTTSPFAAIDVIGSSPMPDAAAVAKAVTGLADEVEAVNPEASVQRISALLSNVVPAFAHVDRRRHLDQKM